eukprot:4758619-Pleurochrysis_carterae.AAC.1
MVQLTGLLHQLTAAKEQLRRADHATQQDCMNASRQHAYMRACLRTAHTVACTLGMRARG